ncbi:hypothetical protein [Anaerolentibacter hominis]|uniref:hypothetical protein n=1 Tax=Anaerolentibacter hominis TaxID=3079009 RepID=UPI0031B83219
MKTTNYVIDNKPVTYEIVSNGYNIYLDGKLWITQHEPYIPFKDVTYEESCLKQMDDLWGKKEDTAAAENA